MRFRAPQVPRTPGFILGVGKAVLFCLFIVALALPSAASSPSLLFDASPNLPTLPDSAMAVGVEEAGESQLRARLLVSSGPDRRVGVLFDLKPGWHLYWRNPGGTGLAPELGLDLPGHQIGSIAWPAPQTFEEAEGLFTTWGYEGSVLLSAPIELLSSGDFRTTSIVAKPRVLVCRTQCVPAEFSLSSPVAQGLDDQDQAHVDALFKNALSRVPLAADEIGLSAEASWISGSPEPDAIGQVKLVVDTCGESTDTCPALATDATSSLFIPIEGETFEYAKAQLTEEARQEGRFVVSVEATRLEPGVDRLWGLIPVRNAKGRLLYIEVDVPITGAPRTALAPVVASSPTPSLAPPANPALPTIAPSSPPAAVPSTEPTAASPLRWIEIFCLALLGGLILNGMPCVLPVLAIKVFAIADMAEKDPREVRLHGLAYTAGVLGSMALLAIAVLALRSAGHSVGWGFQFQEPLFVAAISAILVTFSLNLFGVFEIELGQGKLATVGQEATGVRRSAFEGLLAVVLATPCTAPFLGTAVGFAFASSGFGIAGIFLAIGLGLASPFLVVSFVPNLARFIPRSGPWMNTFRSGLGFSLLATVVWLLWILGQSGGVSAVVSMTGALLFLAFLLWGFGQLQPLRSVWLGRLSLLAITAIAFMSFNLFDFDRAADTASSPASATHDDDWRTYSEEAVAASLANGQPAFVVFTADWCITCQVNEKTVLERDAIREALSQRDYVLFKADWTRPDDTIRTKLAEFGRAGVPLYLIYRPERPNDPIVLSEFLSQREVLNALATTRRI